MWEAPLPADHLTVPSVGILKVFLLSQERKFLDERKEALQETAPSALTTSLHLSYFSKEGCDISPRCEKSILLLQTSIILRMVQCACACTYVCMQCMHVLMCMHIWGVCVMYVCVPCVWCVNIFVYVMYVCMCVCMYLLYVYLCVCDVCLWCVHLCVGAHAHL